MGSPFRFFRRLWARLFGPSPATRAAQGLQIPAPATLVGRIERLDDEDRDMLRIAEEAIRRGFPGQAVIAYAKAARFYEDKGLLPKALSVLIAMLRLAPDNVDAWMARGRVCQTLKRNTDAARALFQAAVLLEAKGERTEALKVLEPCLDLDARTPGLKQLYQTLGGARDLWSSDLIPVEGPTTPRPASVLAAGVAPVARIAPMSVIARPPPAAIAPPLEVLPRATNQAFMPEPVEISAPELQTVLGDTMDGKLVVTDAESAIDLDLSSQLEAAPVLPAKVLPGKIRFNIPNAATAFEPGLPSALIGSEHQAEAESGDLAIPDARTDAYDASVVAGLLARVKQGA